MLQTVLGRYGVITSAPDMLLSLPVLELSGWAIQLWELTQHSGRSTREVWLVFGVGRSYGELLPEGSRLTNRGKTQWIPVSPLPPPFRQFWHTSQWNSEGSGSIQPQLPTAVASSIAHPCSCCPVSSSLTLPFCVLGSPPNSTTSTHATNIK